MLTDLHNSLQYICIKVVIKVRRHLKTVAALRCEISGAFSANWLTAQHWNDISSVVKTTNDKRKCGKKKKKKEKNTPKTIHILELTIAKNEISIGE